VKAAVKHPATPNATAVMAIRKDRRDLSRASKNEGIQITPHAALAPVRGQRPDSATPSAQIAQGFLRIRDVAPPHT
jgi:hypothetical protein